MDIVKKNSSVKKKKLKTSNKQYLGYIRKILRDIIHYKTFYNEMFWERENQEEGEYQN